MKIFWRHPVHLIWIFIAYLPLIWCMSIPMTGDQKTYIAIAQEMWERGEWFRPYLFGEPNYLKPPFQYWMTLISWKLLGFNLLATFLPSLLALVGTSWFLSEIASSLGERRWYVNAGLWFACSIGALTYATSAQMDIYVCLFYAAAWWAGLKFLEPWDDTRNTRWLYLAFAIAGLSALVKSPLYSVLWVFGYISYLVISGEWLLFKNKHLYFALLVGIILGLAWFVGMILTDQERFVGQYWLQEQAHKGSNGGKLKNLWVPLLYLAAPFTLLVLTSLRSVILGRKTNSIMRFVVAWSWPPALFFSIFPYKTSLYLFILVPALAILADWGSFRASRTRTFKWAARITGILLFVALGVGSLTLYRSEFIESWLAALIALTGLVAMVVSWMGWMRVFSFCVLSCILFFRVGSVELMRPDVEALKNLLGTEVRANQVAMLDESKNIWHEIGLWSVVIAKPMKRLYDLDDVIDHLSQGGTLILSDDEMEKYQLTMETFLKTKGYELSYETWKRFKRRTKIPIREILFKGRAGVPDFEERMTRKYQVIRIKPVVASFSFSVEPGV
jgi:4-amino-4-deoxy-L-arabinose transferase-like glycosyltransferase